MWQSHIMGSMSTSRVDLHRILFHLDTITATGIRCGSWNRFQQHAQALGAEKQATPGRFGGLPVFEDGNLTADEVRLDHERDGRKWETRYRIPPAHSE